jgi:hypothetical protein
MEDKIMDHHSPKEVVTRNDMSLDPDAESFFDLVDGLKDGDRLSEGQWKKMYAIVRNEAGKSGRNYAIYKSKNGTTFDITCNTAKGVKLFEYATDPGAYANESPFDRCKRLKAEVDDIDAKINNLHTKRTIAYEKYLESKAQVLEAV